MDNGSTGKRETCCRVNKEMREFQDLEIPNITVPDLKSIRSSPPIPELGSSAISLTGYIHILSLAVGI
jgi:hypothetical protein